MTTSTVDHLSYTQQGLNLEIRILKWGNEWAWGGWWVGLRARYGGGVLWGVEGGGWLLEGG